MNFRYDSTHARRFIPRNHMRPGRLVTVMLSIALVGAIIGAAVGTLLFVVWGFSIEVNRWWLAAAGAGNGAMLGAVLAPITAWAFLRRVALGKALLQVTVGTTIGALIGLIVDRVGVRSVVYSFPAGLVGALVGFLAAAIRLRLTTRTPPVEQGMDSPGPSSRG